MKKPLEIRWHGRGGQGVVTASKILAEALLQAGKYFQAFPEYGPERMGAPVRAYNRVSDQPIRVHCGVTNPEFVIVVDPTLLSSGDILDGLVPEGVVIANFEGTPQELKEKLPIKDEKTVTVDASRISREILGRVVVNTPMLGALCKVFDGVSLEVVADAVKHQFGEKLRQEIIDKNIACLKRAYEEAQIA